MGIHYDKLGSNKILSVDLFRKYTLLIERTGWRKWDRREEDTEEGGNKVMYRSVDGNVTKNSKEPIPVSARSNDSVFANSVFAVHS